MSDLKIKHPLSDFEYDIPTIARHFMKHPRDHRSYDWWRPSSRPPWREEVWQNEDGVMMTCHYSDEDPHPVYLLSFDVEIAVWRWLFEQAMKHVSPNLLKNTIDDATQAGGP